MHFSLFEDLNFFVVCFAALIPAIILGVKERSIKYYGFCVSVIFAGLAMASSYRALIYLVTYIVIEIVLIKAFIRICEAKGRDERVYYIFLILSLTPLILNKVFVNLTLFGFIGISYMTFKSVQMIIEVYDGLIKKIDILDTVYFLVFFPAILCGPIDRSRRFTEEINSVKPRAEYIEALGDGIFKICQGLLYKKVFATLLTMAGLGNMYVYGFQLFFDFAGYSLMAVGVSYILGVSTPGNFNLPFISVDMKDFWNRWHITLSQWFRDYLFSRIARRAMRGKWFNRNKLAQASFALIINMTIMGIWHGLEPHFIVYGIYHGVLLALTEIYQKKSKFYKKYKGNKFYKAASTFVTFNLVMFGFWIFSGQLFI